MGYAKIYNLPITVMLLLSIFITACKGGAGEVSFKPTSIPLKVSINSNGEIKLSIEQSVEVPTPLGTLEVGIIAIAILPES